MTTSEAIRGVLEFWSYFRVCRYTRARARSYTNTEFDSKTPKLPLGGDRG